MAGENPEKRAAILAAALELFAERGFYGTPMPLVAEHAKVGTGTIYRYFESKEALVNVLYRQWKSAHGKAILDKFPFNAPPREKFHVFWRRQVAFAIEEPLAFAFLELHHHAPYLDEASRALESRLLQPVLDFFEETGRQQITKLVPPEVLFSIVCGAWSCLFKASRQSRLELTPEVLDQAETCCWEAIRL